MTFKTLRRRGASLFLALTMCVSLLQVPAYAVEDVEGTVSDAPDLNVTIIPVSDTTATQSNSVNTGDVDTYVPTEVPSTPDAEVGETPSTPDAGKEELPSIPDAGEDETPPIPSTGEEGTPSTPSEDEEDASQTPGESTEEPAEVPEFPTNGTEEDQQEWYQENVDRPEQTPNLDTTTGTDKDIPEKPSEPTEVATNWSVFFDKTTGTYKLTYEIDENAEGDQTIDLTKALDLLNEYANAEQAALDAANAQLKAEKDAALAELENDPVYQEYKTALENAGSNDGKVDQWIDAIHTYGNPNWDPTGKTEQEIYDRFIYDCDWLQGLIIKDDSLFEFSTAPEMPESIKVQLEAIENMPLPDGIGSGNEANVLQPGDIRNFEIYITSKSGHTYKYKDGSFTLATPELNESGSGILGFDGQELGTGANGHTSVEQTYSVSGAIKPLKELMLNAGFSEREIKAGHDTFKDLIETVGNYEKNGDAAVAKVLNALGVEYIKKVNPNSYAPISYEFDNQAMTDAVKAYLVSYYSELDGVNYTDFDDMFAKSTSARSDVSSSENVTQADKGWTFGGETLTVTYDKNFEFNNFYQSLLSFVYGNVEDVAEMLGAVTGTNSNQHPEYDHNNWSSNLEDLGLDYSVVLEQYMSHQAAWDQANEYFNQLLKDGLSVKNATSAAFSMAINLDGELTSNNWQLTKWGWYNSIQLEQADGDLTLTKVEMVDKVDEDGNVVTDEEGNTVQEAQTITDSETKFQLWRIDKDVEIDGVKQNVKMYCTYDAETNTYTFSNVESFLETKDGNLEVLYTLMQDTVYYLQEYEAPKCNDVDADGTTYVYEKDPTVYVIMDPDKCDITMDEAIEANNQFSQNTEDEQYGYLGALTNEGLTVQFVNKKVAVPPTTPPTPEEPTPEEPTPEEPDDPTPPPTTPDRPDRPTTPPPTDIPDPDVPLAPGPDPEEPPVIIEEPDVPLAELPPEVEIPEPEVPLAGQPPVTTTIPEPEVPLADVPMTGDASGLWYALMGLAACGLVVLNLRKKEEA